MSNIYRIEADKKYPSRYPMLVTPEIPWSQKNTTPRSAINLSPTRL
jgi:hypothetical protein